MHSRCLRLLWHRVIVRTYHRQSWTNLRSNVLKPLRRLLLIIGQRSEVASAVREVWVEDEEAHRLLNHLHHLPELPAMGSLTRREYVRQTTDILRQIVRLMPNLTRFRNVAVSHCWSKQTDRGRRWQGHTLDHSHGLLDALQSRRSLQCVKICWLHTRITVRQPDWIHSWPRLHDLTVCGLTTAPSVVPITVPILMGLRHLTIHANLPGSQRFPLDIELLRAGPALRHLTLSGISFYRTRRVPQKAWTWPSLQVVSFRTCLQEVLILDHVGSRQHDIELDNLAGLRRVRPLLLRDRLGLDLDVLAVPAPTLPRPSCVVEPRPVLRASYRSIRGVRIDFMMVALASNPPDWDRLQDCFEHADNPHPIPVGFQE